MSFNLYIVEARDFLVKINALDEDHEIKIRMLDEEYTLLKKFLKTNETDKIKHQIYDMLFILFEISAMYNLDLDTEWNNSQEKKKKYYK